MPSISKEEIEKIFIGLREKTGLDWKYCEIPQIEGPPKPTILATIELSSQSKCDGVTNLHQILMKECKEIERNYEQQLHAQLGVNPDEIRVFAISDRMDLEEIAVTITIDDMNVMKKIAMQLTVPSVQSSDSFKNAVSALREPQNLTELKQDLTTLFDAQEKGVKPGKWKFLNDKWEYGRGKHSGRLALANSDIHIELVEDTTPKSLLFLDKNNNFQPIIDPARQIEIIQGLVNDFKASPKPAM